MAQSRFLSRWRGSDGSSVPERLLQMSSELAIKVHDLSKHYLIYRKPEDRLKQMLVPRLQRFFGLAPTSFYRDFPAVSHVSFEVRRGETVGIVGRNGSGKSTLLQMICGTLQPTGGTIEVYGRIAALLELGSGFNPEFTGRENVYLNASILGLSKTETDARFDSIAAFAEIGDFIDQPVKTYSSGMYVRLAFAVAINVDPDILIVDEALSVGDEAFQRKCFARIEQIRAAGATILFVSHGAQTIVQLCDRAILMDRGEKLLEGKPKTVLAHYQRMINMQGEAAEVAREAIKVVDGWAADVVSPAKVDAPARPATQEESRLKAWFDPSLISGSKVEFQQKGARVADVQIIDADGHPVNTLVLNERYWFQIEVDVDAYLPNLNFGMLVKTISGVELAGQHAFPFDEHISADAGDRLTITFPFDCMFLPGTYSCNCGMFTRSGASLDIGHRILDAILFRVMPVDARYSRVGIVDICPANPPVRVERQSYRKLA
jgi:lipopolysaccharide transport system ATP-binding protein